ELRFFVRVLEIHDRKGDARVAGRVAAFQRPVAGADQDAVALASYPDRYVLGGTIGHEGREVNEVWTVEKLLDFVLKSDAHDTPPGHEMRAEQFRFRVWPAAG